jgi:curved DNA-binding protein CbpA
MQKVSESGEFIFAWLRVLDELTYYELLEVQPTASGDQIRTAFHRFCDTFHPDRHVARSSNERDALLAIFKRGTEAYLALADVGLRSQYDEQLASMEQRQPPRISHTVRSRPPPSQAPGAARRLEEAARSPSSRPFARRADELIEAGDLRQAKLQLVMANHLDPGNADFESALRQIEARLAGPK